MVNSLQMISDQDLQVMLREARGHSDRVPKEFGDSETYKFARLFVEAFEREFLGVNARGRTRLVKPTGLPVPMLSGKIAD